MRQVYKIDKDGFYLEPVLIGEADLVPDDCVEEMPTEGLFKAKFDGEKFVETLSQAEIDEIKNKPIELSEMEKLKYENEQLVKRLEETENAIIFMMDMNLL